MVLKQCFRVTIREKRQVTLPAELCKELGVKPGDWLEVKFDGERVMLIPQERVALDALEEVRRAIEEAGVTEEELIASGDEVAAEQFRNDYPDIAQQHGV